MSKLKKVLLMCTAYVLVAALAIGGTIAYLQDDDSDVNVMTLGNVKIAQHEYERAVDANGAYETKEIDGVNSYVLKDFTQGKDLLPIVGDPSTGAAGWDNTVVRMTQVDSYGSMQVFAGKNAQDKFVTVENTGKTDAYIRTIVAIEIGSTDGTLIGTSFHSTWESNNVGTITVDGNNYMVVEYAYVGGQLSDGSWRHENGVLPAGDTSYPNLSQVYIKSVATNEDMEAIDGNGNGTLDILVLSQAVQSAGFADAKTALDAGFGKSSEKAAEWFGGVLAGETDVWDGTVDTSWYNETDTEFTLNSAAQFAGFATLVSEDADNFAGKTINLGTSVDLNGMSFAPIGTTGERDSRNRLIVEPFKGTFDGNGNTIANISQSGWDFGYEWGQYGSLGLFSELENATVKNVVLEGFDCAVEGGDISFIAGSATGNCTFENIEIKSGSIGTYNNGIGGIIGWSGAGTYNFKNITIGEDVVIGGLWGSFDSSVGGIVGQAEPGATYNFENVTVACQLDVFNDCTASYDYYNYRMCGMLIGRLEETTTIDGVNYPDTSKYNITCTNVTVTYGEWANYHYCDPTPGYNNGRGMRVESSANYSGLPADYDHSQCTTHHNELIPFDQIFGGAQLGVKGLKTYDGVTVIYNNK